MFDGQVAAREDSGRLVLFGELERWNDVVRAGMTAVRDHPYIGLVNEVLCTGEKPLPIRTPRIVDSALEWDEPDVLIIGGGVIGCAIARELSRYKLDVLLVEKEHDLAMQTSGRNDGVIHSGLDLKKGTYKYKYNKLGNQMFDRICRELGVRFERCGQFLCFARRIWEPFMYISLLYWWWLGVKGVEVIGRDQLHKLEPGVNPDISAALYFPETGIVCPFDLTIAYAENAVKNGVNIRFNTMVLDMTTEDGMITSVQTNRGTVRPKLVINAAGVFCEDVAAMADDRFFSIHPRKGTNIILDKKFTKTLVRTTVSSMGTATGRKKRHTKGGGIVRTIDGNALIGPDAVETMNKEDFSTNIYSINEIFRNHRKTIPGLDEKQAIAYFSGIRAATYEEDFIITRGIYISNIIHAAGIQSPGLTAAPAIGVDVAKLAVDFFGGERILQANPEFDPIRRAPPRPLEMDANTRATFIAQNPDYGIIVCRCEEISKGEILEAMNRNVRCHSIDGIKRRVRPGMGRCQGGFCSPLVLDLIAKEKHIPHHKVTKNGGGSEYLFGCTKTLALKQSSAKTTNKNSGVYRASEDLMREHSKNMLASTLSQRKDDGTGDDN